MAFVSFVESKVQSISAIANYYLVFLSNYFSYTCGMKTKTQNKPNSGRKRLPKGEKKIGVTLYIKESVIDKYGGRTKIVTKLMPAVDEL